MTGKRMIVDTGQFVAAAADWIEEKVDEVLQNSDRCHLMLAGGGTPLPVYASIAKRGGLPWQRIVIYFGDERCVPPLTPENNAFMVISRLFPDGVPPGVTVHRMCGEEEPDQAARAYEQILPPRIDVLLLGMGDDGHTASLFPGSVALDEENRRVMPVIGSKPPLQRLTITPAVIRQARHVLLMAQGEERPTRCAGLWRTVRCRLPWRPMATGCWIAARPAICCVSRLPRRTRYECIQ